MLETQHLWTCRYEGDVHPCRSRISLPQRMYVRSTAGGPAFKSWRRHQLQGPRLEYSLNTLLNALLEFT